MKQYLVHDSRTNTTFTGDLVSVIGQVATFGERSVTVQGFKQTPLHSYASHWTADEIVCDRAKVIARRIARGDYPGLSIWRELE